MNKALGIVMVVVAVAISFIVFPIVLDSSEELRTDNQADTFAAVATGVGETDADVVLTVDLWQDTAAYVVSIASDNGGDTPVAGTYTAATNTLNVTGLADDDTRELIVTYQIAALDDYTGLDAIVAVAPLLLFIGILGAIIGGLWSSWKSR
jgi:hypothetical protein